jgi:hypothetical protein
MHCELPDNVYNGLLLLGWSLTVCAALFWLGFVSIFIMSKIPKLQRLLPNRVIKWIITEKGDNDS